MVGSDTGVFSAPVDDPTSWIRVGKLLPRAPVLHLEYSPTDHLLLAGTIGRARLDPFVQDSSRRPPGTRPGPRRECEAQSGGGALMDSAAEIPWPLPVGTECGRMIKSAWRVSVRAIACPVGHSADWPRLRPGPGPGVRRDSTHSAEESMVASRSRPSGSPAGLLAAVSLSLACSSVPCCGRVKGRARYGLRAILGGISVRWQGV